MNIKIRTSGEIRIIDFNGSLESGTSSEAESAVSELIEAGHSKLVINLADTDYVSSSGLRVFLITAKKIAAVKGKLRICQPNPVVREILDISGFSTILDVRSSEAEALAELLL